MKYCLIFLTVALSAGMVCAQSKPKAGPKPATSNSQLPTSSSKRAAATRELQLRDLENIRAEDKPYVDLLAIYDKPSKKDLEILSPDKEAVSRYIEFLRGKNTGVFKLNSNAKCANSTDIVNAGEECSKYKIPGGGTAYSFRYGTYRILRLSDLALAGSVLRSDGVLQQGVMVDLGDRPIESIDLSADGLKYLIDLKPVTTKPELDKMDRELLPGIKADGHLYQIGLFAKLNHTYALRSVAFEGHSVRTVNGTTYDEFLFDKRKDVVVVFRVVASDPNGNLTIVWRELSRSNAPKLDS